MGQQPIPGKKKWPSEKARLGASFREYYLNSLVFGRFDGLVLDIGGVRPRGRLRRRARRRPRGGPRPRQDQEGPELLPRLALQVLTVCMQGDTSAWLKPFVDIVLTVAHDFNIFYFLSFSVYKGDIICDVEGSVSLVFKFAFPPFSPPLPSGVQFSKQNAH